MNICNGMERNGMEWNYNRIAYICTDRLILKVLSLRIVDMCVQSARIVNVMR